MNKTDLMILSSVAASYEYAAYKGDDFIGIGTLEELAVITGLSLSTLHHRSYPYGHKRAGNNGVILINLDKGDN